MFESINAITLATRDMPSAVTFYNKLGLHMVYGGQHSDFTTFKAGSGFINLFRSDNESVCTNWGRVILHVVDVDALYETAINAGLEPAFAPEDAPWGERYFHIRDADGHELSFAKPIDRPPA